MGLLKLRTVSFIETSCSDEAKKFLLRQFDFKMITVLFANWQFKDKGSYQTYVNKIDSRIFIESYPVGYSIYNRDKSYTIPFHPRTLDQFITDCQRAGLELTWSENILDEIDYQKILNGEDIMKYHVTLLQRIDRSDDIIFT